MQVTTVERGSLAPPEVEALQASREVAEAWGVGSARPCVALIYLDGASRGDGRQKLAHLLGMEMHSLGLDAAQVEKHLRDWNTRTVPPLQVSEIRKVTRQLITRPERCYSYGCGHLSLATYCIGEDCPERSSKKLWRLSNVTANGLTASGWLPLLTGTEVRVWLGLYRLARLRGRVPNAQIPFTFRELERVSGVNRHYHRDVLERLNKRGLLAEVSINTVKGENSTYRFPPALPQPKSTPKKPLSNKGVSEVVVKSTHRPGIKVPTLTIRSL